MLRSFYLKSLIKNLAYRRRQSEQMVELGISVGHPDTVELEFRHSRLVDNLKVTINTLLNVYFEDDEEFREEYFIQ